MKPYDLSCAFHLGLKALGLRYTRREVAARLARHPHAGSLLAVTDLATSFGVAVTAVRCGLDDVDSDTIPVILQLAGGGDSGFTVAVGRTGGRLSLLDPGGATREVAQADLDPSFTGVAVFLEAGEAGVPEPAYLRHLLREMPVEWAKRLARRLPVFGGAGGILRLLALGLLAAGTFLALARASGAHRGLLAAGLSAAVAVAAFLSFGLLALSRPAVSATGPTPLAERLCGSGRLVDCTSVFHSRWAGVGPWPLASLGAAWFLSLLAAFSWSEVLSPEADAGVLWLGLALLLTAPVSLFLVLVQIWPLRKLCPLCLALHLAVLAGAGAGGSLLRFPSSLGQLVPLGPTALLHAWLFLLALGLLVPWLRDSGELARQTAKLGAATATPLGALALTLAVPPLPVGSAPELLVWGAARAPLRIDGFLNPTCISCGPILSELLALAERHGDRVRLAVHLVPRDGAPDSSERSLLLALLALAGVCGRETALEAFWRIKTDPEPWLKDAAAGAGPVAARLGGLPSEEIEPALPAAGEALARAADLAALAQSGLPFVLVAGRRFPAAVRHLRDLVAFHYPLLLESLALAPRAQGSEAATAPPAARGAAPPDGSG